MKRSGSFNARLALALGVSVAMNVNAQTSDESTKTTVLEEIIVTAQKRSESLQNVPIAISVTTQEQIERDQIYSLADLQRTSPALEVNQSFGGETGGGRIRGIGTNVFNATAEGSVAIVVDGVPSGNVPNPQVFDIAQIEVLRGPQGTLFGQTSSAGVVNMSTIAPDPSGFSSTFHTDYSSKGKLGSKFGQQSVRGAVNVPLTDSSAMRIGAYGTRVEGVQRNVRLNEDNVSENYGLRARYLWEPSEAFSLNLIADYNEEQIDGSDFFTYATQPVASNPRTGLLAACGIDPGYDNQDYCADRMTTSDAKNYGYSAQLGIDLGGPTLTSITGYRRRDSGGAHREITRLVGDVPQIYFANELSTAYQFTQELRIASPDGTSKFDYVAGAYYSEYNYRNGVGAGGGGFNLRFPWPATAPQCAFGGACSIVNSFTPAVVENSSIAGFADLTYRITDAFRVFGGVRYTEQTIDSMSGTNAGKLEEDNVSGRLGFAYRPSPAAMFYGSVARGYKGPIYFVSSDPSVPSRALQPEKPTSYEIGAKFSMLDDRLAIDGNIFYSEVKNYQAETCTTSALGALQCTPLNIEQVESQGIEIDVIGRPFDGLSLNAGFIFNPVEYPDGLRGSDGSDLGGKQLVLAPKHKFVLSGEYSHNMFGNVDWFISIETVQRSELRLNTSASDLYVYPSSWQVGGSLGLRAANGRWLASMFGRNLTDENIPVTMFGANPANGLWGWPIANQTLRQVGLTVDFKF